MYSINKYKAIIDINISKIGLDIVEDYFNSIRDKNELYKYITLRRTHDIFVNENSYNKNKRSSIFLNEYIDNIVFDLNCVPRKLDNKNNFDALYNDFNKIIPHIYKQLKKYFFKKLNISENNYDIDLYKCINRNYNNQNFSYQTSQISQLINEYQPLIIYYYNNTCTDIFVETYRIIYSPLKDISFNNMGFITYYLPINITLFNLFSMLYVVIRNKRNHTIDHIIEINNKGIVRNIFNQYDLSIIKTNDLKYDYMNYIDHRIDFSYRNHIDSNDFAVKHIIKEKCRSKLRHMIMSYCLDKDSSIVNLKTSCLNTCIKYIDRYIEPNVLHVDFSGIIELTGWNCNKKIESDELYNAIKFKYFDDSKKYSILLNTLYLNTYILSSTYQFPKESIDRYNWVNYDPIMLEKYSKSREFVKFLAMLSNRVLPNLYKIINTAYNNKLNAQIRNKYNSEIKFLLNERRNNQNNYIKDIFSNHNIMYDHIKLFDDFITEIKYYTGNIDIQHYKIDID